MTSSRDDRMARPAPPNWLPALAVAGVAALAAVGGGGISDLFGDDPVVIGFAAVGAFVMTLALGIVAIEIAHRAKVRRHDSRGGSGDSGGFGLWGHDSDCGDSGGDGGGGD
ncbi:hypothetical protein [Methylobrevis albus]|uniref:Uncharacterized protein n=1 Tax=Methylobrevis albus TaxID=2793297 RepID=A0A931I110_9HYPH|nr:hypothetical protein [Methylobrevis albus]MBH0237389.1 hypothetical protein [Methylobrevis albus]